MRWVRYRQGNEQPRFGWIMEDRVGPVDGNPFEEYRRLEANLQISQVRLLAPVIPGKIIGVGLNYIERSRELGLELSPIPQLFMKPPSAVIGPGSAIVLPPQSQQVEHEATLAVVIGKTGRWIAPEEALEHILGFTVANDVTARDLQAQDEQWVRCKGFDTFCPLGPWIETEFDPADSLITCRVGNALRQMASTREMVFHVPELVAFISATMTLNPGDVILTGTPAGTGLLVAGDVVESSVEGIGDLKNPVIRALE